MDRNFFYAIYAGVFSGIIFLAITNSNEILHFLPAQITLADIGIICLLTIVSWLIVGATGYQVVRHYMAIEYARDNALKLAGMAGATIGIVNGIGQVILLSIIPIILNMDFSINYTGLVKLFISSLIIIILRTIITTTVAIIGGSLAKAGKSVKIEDHGIKPV